MANADAPAGDTELRPPLRDAGFWKRALAMLIDACLVTSLVSILLLVLAVAIPGIGKAITLNTPFGIGAVERTVEDKSTETTDASGTKTVTIDKTIERTVLDRWIYRYHVEGQRTEYTGESFVTSFQTNNVWQIDPATGEPISTTEGDHIAFAVLMLYWILADASRYRGSLGKRLIGLSVVDGEGARLTLAASAGRNLLKIVSAIPALLGFMMAGWTQRKQALHDKLVGTYVVTAR